MPCTITYMNFEVCVGLNCHADHDSFVWVMIKVRWHHDPPELDLYAGDERLPIVNGNSIDVVLTSIEV